MEKTWMYMNRLSQQYEDGVDAFLKFAIQNACDAKLIPCPCAKCANTSKLSHDIIRAHLMKYRIDLTYEKWIWHGERMTSKRSASDCDSDEKSDANCNHEEPIDMIRDAYDAFEDNPHHFQTLLEDGQKPLYSSCRRFTKLSATVKLYNLKAKYGWSDTSVDDLLRLLREMLPEDNELPSSLYEAKKSISTLGLYYEKIHACPNDCILYRKEYEESSECPTCGTSRWKVDKNGKSMLRVPSKVLWYFPPIPRFRRMFRTMEISKELTWHADKRINDGYLRHPADAPAWKLVDNKWEDFGKEARNLKLALAADGINPHSLMNSKYSCWPVILVTYNLPPWLCMKRRFMMLTLLIVGPKQPGNDIDVYLAPLIDDLKVLWETGVEAYDAYRDQKFTLKAVLMWTINDFPAYGNLSGCSVKGYKACPICAAETCSKWLPHSKTISYMGHRRFLPQSHPFRRQKKAFYGLQDFNPAPLPLSGCAVFNKVDGHKSAWGEMKGKSRRAHAMGKKLPAKKRKISERATTSVEDSCFKKKSIFLNLSIGSICIFVTY